MILLLLFSLFGINSGIPMMLKPQMVLKPQINVTQKPHRHVARDFDEFRFFDPAQIQISSGIPMMLKPQMVLKPQMNVTPLSPLRPLAREFEDFGDIGQTQSLHDTLEYHEDRLNKALDDLKVFHENAITAYYNAGQIYDAAVKHQIETNVSFFTALTAQNVSEDNVIVAQRAKDKAEGPKNETKNLYDEKEPEIQEQINYWEELIKANEAKIVVLLNNCSKFLGLYNDAKTTFDESVQVNYRNMFDAVKARVANVTAGTARNVALEEKNVAGEARTEAQTEYADKKPELENQLIEIQKELAEFNERWTNPKLRAYRDSDSCPSGDDSDSCPSGDDNNMDWCGCSDSKFTCVETVSTELCPSRKATLLNTRGIGQGCFAQYICEAIAPSIYYEMEQGACCCPSGGKIESRDECIEAVRSLGLSYDNPATGSWDSIPGGCNWRDSQSLTNLHWNSLDSSTARGDMSPICKDHWTPTRIDCPGTIFHVYNGPDLLGGHTCESINFNQTLDPTVCTLTLQSLNDEYAAAGQAFKLIAPYNMSYNLDLTTLADLCAASSRIFEHCEATNQICFKDGPFKLKSQNTMPVDDCFAACGQNVALPHPQRQTEFYQIRDLLPSNSRVWLGIKKVNGVWQRNGVPYTGANAWGSNEGDTGENFAAMIFDNSQTSGRWFDVYSTGREYYCVCQAPSNYYKMDVGACCCPSGAKIQSQDECLVALKSLDLSYDNPWIGSIGSIPGGCTWRGSSHNLHWNSLDSSTARGDLSPVCKKPKCIWHSTSDVYSSQYANGFSAKMTLGEAKLKCLALSSTCRAVTCKGSSCTVRASSVLSVSASGETSHVPGIGCFLSIRVM